MKAPKAAFDVVREYSIHVDDFRALGPQETLERMQRAGFVFDTSTCPFKIRQPFDSYQIGSRFFYRQGHVEQ